MRSKKHIVDIADMYALKLGALWRALKNEHISFWMLCIYFFFEYVRPQSLYPVIDVLPWAQIFLLASLITAFTDKSVQWTKNALNRWLLLFTFVIILSGVFAFRPAVSIDYWTVFGGWLVVYFLVINIVNTEKRLLLFMLAYCLFSLKMAQHGAIGWASRGFSFASYGLIGAPGWFRNSGEYAIQMLIFGSLAIALVFSLKDYWGRYKKLFFFAVAATGYMAVMGASSRGAQLALIVMGIWLALKREGGLRGVAVLLVVAFILYHFLPDEQIQRFKEIGQDTNSLQRLAYWTFAVNEVIPEFPVIGIGYNNWLTYIWYKYPEGMGPMEFNQESHNIFIQATSELGFVGLFVFIMLIIYAFINTAQTRKLALKSGNKLLFYLAYGLEAGMVGYLVAGMFVTVLYYPFFWVQLAMIAATHTVAKRSINDSERTTEPGNRSVGVSGQE